MQHTSLCEKAARDRFWQALLRLRASPTSLARNPESKPLWLLLILFPVPFFPPAVPPPCSPALSRLNHGNTATWGGEGDTPDASHVPLINHTNDDGRRTHPGWKGRWASLINAAWEEASR